MGPRDLGKGVNDLRDKTVLTLRSGRGERPIEVTRGDGGHFTLQLSDGKWSLDGSDQAGRRGAAIGSFVGALSRLNGTQVLGDAPHRSRRLRARHPGADHHRERQGRRADRHGAGRLAQPEPAGDAVHDQARDQPTVFELRDFQFKQLDKKPADFVAAPPARRAGLPPGMRRRGEDDAEAVTEAIDGAVRSERPCNGDSR